MTETARISSGDSYGWALERSLWRLGYGCVAGVDEAGRGALAGPVAAAVVALPYQDYPYRDSKTLSPTQRNALAARISEEALAWGIGYASAGEVDTLNVLRATHLAAERALGEVRERLNLEALVTDFLRLEFGGPVVAVPRGDRRSYNIAAASILAKTARDRIMCELDAVYPHYGFARHKGYGSPHHLCALSQYGPCELHRRSFRPVAQARLFTEPES